MVVSARTLSSVAKQYYGNTRSSSGSVQAWTWCRENVALEENNLDYIGCDHTSTKAPDPIRTPKLSVLGRSTRMGDLLGSPRVASLFLWYFSIVSDNSMFFLLITCYMPWLFRREHCPPWRNNATGTPFSEIVFIYFSLDHQHKTRNHTKFQN